MNKSFTAAIAIAATAGLACAEIATPPAGYVDVTSTGSAFVINPFNAFEGSLKLGDIDGSQITDTSARIKVIGANGKKLFEAKWRNESGFAVGWWTWVNSNFDVNTNSHSFKRGESVQFNTSVGETQTITMAGVLNGTEESVTCVKGHNFVGNVAPADKSLSAFTVEGANYSPLGSDYIYVGGQKMVYLPANIASRAHLDAGWYIKSDITGSNPEDAVAQNPTIAAGTGFRAYFTKAGVSINAPGL